MRKLLLASAATMGALLVTVGGAQAQPVTQPAPGTVAVHLNGYLQFAIGDLGSSYSDVGGNKLNPVTTNGDARLYAGFDAETLNGIDYGAQIELRTTTSNPGEGVGKTIDGTGSNASGMYVKRAYGYIGTRQAGFVRLGQTDSAFSLLQTGVLEGFGDGAQWNVDGGILQTSPVVPTTIAYADASALYATDKIVYLSPTIAGFSMGVGFEPSSNGLKEGTAACAESTLTDCSSISSSETLDSDTQRKNTIDAAVMYSGDLGGFATKANFGVLNAAPVDYTGTLSAADPRYNDMTVYQAGAQTSYAGLTLGASVKWGAVNSGYTFIQRGARDAVAYIVNGTYVAGPYVIGASFFDQQAAGSYVAGTSDYARTQTQYGVATGVNYVIGKDLSLFAQYMYGQIHQPTTVATARTNLQMQIVETGATFKW
jgi:Gram-negative porin